MNGYPQTGIFDFVRRDHDAIRSHAYKARIGDPAALAIFTELVRRHAAAEEQTLYAWMREVSDFAPEAVRSQDEHAEALRRLDAGDVRGVDFVIEHLDHEDQVLLPVVLCQMPLAAQTRLGARYESAAVQTVQIVAQALPPIEAVQAPPPVEAMARPRQANPLPVCRVPVYRAPVSRTIRVSSLQNPRVRVATTADVVREVVHRVLGLPAVFMWRRKNPTRSNPGCVDPTIFDDRPISLRRSR